MRSAGSSPIGGGHGRDGVGASVLWLGHVALEGVRLAARGSVVPTLRVPRQPQGRTVDARRCAGGRRSLDSPAIVALAAAMPGTVAAIGGGDGRATTTAVITAVVEAIVAEASSGWSCRPRRRPSTRRPTCGDALIARMDGSPFRAPAVLAAERVADARPVDPHGHVGVPTAARRAARSRRVPGGGVAGDGARAAGQGRARRRSTPRCGPSAAADRVAARVGAPRPAVPRDQPRRTCAGAGRWR